MNGIDVRVLLTIFLLVTSRTAISPDDDKHAL